MTHAHIITVQHTCGLLYKNDCEYATDDFSNGNHCPYYADNGICCNEVLRNVELYRSDNLTSNDVSKSDTETDTVQK